MSSVQVRKILTPCGYLGCASLSPSDVEDEGKRKEEQSPGPYENGKTPSGETMVPVLVYLVFMEGTEVRMTRESPDFRNSPS